MYLHRLFLVFSCAHPIFRHVIIHSFLFCFAFKPHKFFITFYTLFEHFLPHQISSIKFDHSFVYIGMLSSLVNLIHHVLTLFICFCLCFCLFAFAFDYQLLFS